MKRRKSIAFVLPLEFLLEESTLILSCIRDRFEEIPLKIRRCL